MDVVPIRSTGAPKLHKNEQDQELSWGRTVNLKLGQRTTTPVVSTTATDVQSGAFVRLAYLRMIAS
jgi:hypothetical protein